MAAAPAAAGTFGQIICAGNTPKLNGLGNPFLDATLQFVHFLLRVEETGSHRIFEQGFAVLLKCRDFCRLKGLSVVLLLLKRLALAHEGFILAASARVSQKGINPLADISGMNLFENGFAQFLRFYFNF